MIDGSRQDFKLIMDFVPAYLPDCARIYNIMGGISLGGHTAWRIASLGSGRFHWVCDGSRFAKFDVVASQSPGHSD